MLHFSCPPIIGGVESVMATHARLFLNAGYPVTVITGRGAKFDRRLRMVRVPEIDSTHRTLLELNESFTRGDVGEPAEEFSAAIEAALAPTLRELDVCFVHNALTLHFNLPLTAALHRLAARLDCKFVAWCHDLSWTNPLYLPSMVERAPWTLLKTPAHGATYVTVSPFRRDELDRLFHGRAPVVSVPNGIDVPRFLGVGRACTVLVEQLDLLAADPFLLLPSRITRRKNIQQAIRIVAALKSMGRRPRLLVTGPPGPHNVRSIDYVDELDALARALGVGEEVILLHRVKRPGGGCWRASDAMIAQLYRLADALLFPSAQEGFGIPVLEAGLARLPIFCADIAPLRDLGGESVSYFGVDEDPALVARRIIEALRQRDESRLHRTVVRGFDWRAIFRDQIQPLAHGASSTTRLPEPTIGATHGR